jgi:phage shock protein PspC (stress-responsive transcriptional regulator)
MKKIININLSGRVIPIEDSAYESLQRYIESLRRFFVNEEGRDEIINDIESRIAELMNDKIKKGVSAITDGDIEEIIQSMGRVEDFEEAETAEPASSKQQTKTEAAQEPQKKRKGRLYRDSSDKILGGVASGLANYLDIDPAVIRILLIIFGFTGTGVILYIILWIFLPAKDLNDYVGKRLFRNPEDKVIAGVAGGLAAYFDKPSWVIRLILVSPLLLNIMFGTFNGIFFSWHRDIFPNVFIAPFTGTFILAYVILWMVLPEARSSFEKMEMRGEKVDVNRIRQNVKDEMENIKTKAQAWGEEVKSSATQLGTRAKEFANTRGKAFAGEVASSTRPVAQGIGHIIGVIFKAFFVFVAGCIALSLFAVIMVIIFGGVAWWPINNFLWTSTVQKFLAWGVLLFFLATPVIGFMTWLIRRVVRVRSRNKNLSWIFGGLWLIGWICAIVFAISIAKDLRVYERTNAMEVPITQPATKMVLKVNEPEVSYSGNVWWIHAENTGWDITEDTMKYNNVKLRINKSDDSLYHVKVYKYSAGQSLKDAQERANQIGFNIVSQDSILNMSSGITITRDSKFRGQGLIMEIEVPAGKQIRFDQSVAHAYNPWVIRRSARDYGRWSRRGYQPDWDYDEYFDWDTDVDYVMTTDGKLVEASKAVKNNKGIYEKKNNVDSLRIQIEEREKQNEKDRQKLDEMQQNRQDSTPSTTQRKEKKDEGRETILAISPFAPLII